MRTTSIAYGAAALTAVVRSDGDGADRRAGREAGRAGRCTGTRAGRRRPVSLHRRPAAGRRAARRQWRAATLVYITAWPNGRREDRAEHQGRLNADAVSAESGHDRSRPPTCDTLTRSRERASVSSSYVLRGEAATCSAAAPRRGRAPRERQGTFQRSSKASRSRSSAIIRRLAPTFLRDLTSSVEPAPQPCEVRMLRAQGLQRALDGIGRSPPIACVPLLIGNSQATVSDLPRL